MLLNLSDHKYRSPIIFVVFFFICIFTYGNSLNNDFIFDDYSIFSDPLIKDIKYLPYHFHPDKSNLLAKEISSEEVYYRPLAYSIWMICYLFFNGSTFGYHFTNVVLLTVAGFLIYLFFNALFRNWSLAFLTAVLFIVHPMNGLIVNYITASIFAFQLSCLFLSLWAFLQVADHKKQHYFFLSLACFILALLTHETSMVLPFYVTLILFYRKEEWKNIAVKSAPYFGVAGLYFFFRMFYASIKTSILDKFSNFEMNLPQFIATYTKLAAWYLVNLFTLDGIVLKWATPVLTGEQVWPWLLGLLLFLILLGLSLWLYRKKRIVILAVAWLLIGFLPVLFACLFEPKTGLIIEPHWLFFPSVGFFLLLAFSLTELQSQMPRRSWQMIVIFIILSWIVVSWRYNRLWSDDLKYSQFWLKQVPGYKSVQFYLANAYSRNHQFDKGRAVYRQALESEKTDWQIYNNLGLMDLAEGHYQDAERNFLLAVNLNPASALGYNNLGTTYLRQNKTAEAKKAFRYSIEINRFLLEPHLNLASVYEQQGEPQAAFLIYQNNLKRRPDEPKSLYAIMKIYLEQNEPEMAQKTAGQLIQHTSDAVILTQAGSLLAAHNLNPLALDAYEKAIQVNPQYPDAYIEIGKLLGNMRKYDLAIQFWQEGSRFAPGDPRFDQLIAQAQKLKSP